MSKAKYQTLDATQSAKYILLNPKTLILDFRDESYYIQDHLKTAKYLNLENLEVWIAKNQAKKNQPILVHCGSGVRSPQACTILANNGFTNILCSKDGYKVIKPIYDNLKAQPKIFSMSFAGIYKLYIIKVQSKNRTIEEMDTLIYWLTGYNQKTLKAQIDNYNDLQTFFDEAPKLNPKATNIKGIICGYRIEDIPNPLMRKIRYMDKLIDELAKGKSVEKILNNYK